MAEAYSSAYNIHLQTPLYAPHYHYATPQPRIKHNSNPRHPISCIVHARVPWGTLGRARAHITHLTWLITCQQPYTRHGVAVALLSRVLYYFSLLHDASVASGGCSRWATITERLYQRVCVILEKRRKSAAQKSARLKVHPAETYRLLALGHVFIHRAQGGTADMTPPLYARCGRGAE
jgi:hypothetical protein